jgi:hypothetical protein
MGVESASSCFASEGKGPGLLFSSDGNVALLGV